MNYKIITEYKNKVGSSFVDSLTGLYNHGLFQLLLEREIQRVDRNAHPFVLAMIDIDRFRRFNREHGHYLGDRMLKEVADLIRSKIRRTDVAARFSSGTFVVLFIDCDTTSSLKITERIRTSVKEIRDGSLTVSIGLVEYTVDDRNKEALIRRAEEALQGAKLKGRDQVFFYEKKVNCAQEPKPQVLLANDSQTNMEILTAMLTSLNYEVIQACDGMEALNISAKNELDLVLLDVMTPEMNSFDVCRRLKNNKLTRITPVILITKPDDMNARVKGIACGADDFVSKPPDKMELIVRTNSLIKLKKLNNNLTIIEKVLFSMAKAVEANDRFTRGHAERTANLAVAVARTMALEVSDIEALRFGCRLHDIGKIGMPHAVLNKPGKLDNEELKIIRSHPEVGYNICLPLEKTLGAALNVIRHHHERLDGSGYPDGLKGDEISTVARIMAVVDSFDALTSDRSYRKGISTRNAFEILRKEAQEGKLDPVIVEHLLEIAREETLG